MQKRLPSKELKFAKHSSKRSCYLSKKAKELYKDLTLNEPLLKGFHNNLSTHPLLTLMEYNTWEKEAKPSTSQSCAALLKLTFHWLEPPKNSKLAATETSFSQARPYKTRKATFRVVIPHHWSYQNQIFDPSPTSKHVKLESLSHHFLIFFYNPTPKTPASSRGHHPPHKLTNLESTATLHQASLSSP
jgi:hypothetical protein